VKKKIKTGVIQPPTKEGQEPPKAGEARNDSPLKALWKKSGLTTLFVDISLNDCASLILY
jgi:hypothetical protein